MKSDLNVLLSNTRQEDGCFLWTRCLNSEGYARANIGGNVNTKVHRLVYTLVHGPISKDQVVRHTCDIRSCINPDHLEIGTPYDNVQDREQRGRNGIAKLKVEDVAAIRAVAASTPNISRVELAKLYGVDARTISSVILNKHWKRLLP